MRIAAGRHEPRPTSGLDTADLPVETELSGAVGTAASFVGRSGNKGRPFIRVVARVTGERFTRYRACALSTCYSRSPQWCARVFSPGAPLSRDVASLSRAFHETRFRAGARKARATPPAVSIVRLKCCLFCKARARLRNGHFFTHGRHFFRDTNECYTLFNCLLSDSLSGVCFLFSSLRWRLFNAFFLSASSVGGSTFDTSVMKSKNAPLPLHRRRRDKKAGHDAAGRCFSISPPSAANALLSRPRARDRPVSADAGGLGDKGKNKHDPRRFVVDLSASSRPVPS